MSRIGNDPYVDWLLMLSIFFVTVVLFVGAGFGVYNQVETQLATPVTTATAGHSDIFDPKALSGVLDVFKDRAAAKDMIIQGTWIPSDPSL